MDTTSTVGHYNFGAWDLPTKYGWMHSGPGAQAATVAQDAARSMAERMIESGKLVGGLLSGAEWVGAAATAAGEAMRRGAGQLDQTAVQAATAERCFTELGESFAAAQHRVPAPNEVPTGLGDQFLYGMAEGFNVLSPFDVQSPLHDAMERRRELEHQANLALTDHMTSSRERLEAIPVVTAPAPITVAAQSAGAPGAGSVGAPPGALPGATRPGGSPTSTPPAGWPGTPSPSPTSPTGTSPVPGPGVPLPVTGGQPPLTSSQPRYVPGIGPAGGRIPGMRPAAFWHPGVGPRGTGGDPRSGGRTGEATARGTGFGTRPGTGAGGLVGRGGPGLGGAGLGAPAGQVGGGIGAAGTGRPGPASYLHPPLGSRSGENDREHKDRYAQHTDHIVGELPLVAPSVIGETPEEEDHRLRHARGGR